jgi:predicted nucleic acid-binding protein
VKLYLDSSVLLRRLLGQPGAIAMDDRYSQVGTSVLSEVECLRTLDRIRVLDRLDDDRIANLRAEVFKHLQGMAVVEMTRSVLQRASQPMPTALGTLDSIHLSTALLWREGTGEELALATHDRALATAARANGIAVVGI